jgi:hypothetical protein
MMKLFGLFVVLVSVLWLSSYGEAQLINYDRRNRKQQSVNPEPPSPASSSNSFESKSTSTKAITRQEKTEVKEDSKRSDSLTKPWGEKMITVSNRVEKIYDLNDDGILQDDEIADILRDVLSSVRSRGNFMVSSPLLQFFDTDGDGLISHYEANAIRVYLDQRRGIQ